MNSEHTVKVIATSNFDDATFPEYEVARFVKGRNAFEYCEWLNSQLCASDPVWYSVVAIEKRLWSGMQDLIEGY